jgi:hypothetical protein
MLPLPAKMPLQPPQYLPIKITRAGWPALVGANDTKGKL